MPTDWPDHVLPDVSLDGYFDRMNKLEKAFVGKIGLDKKDAIAALTSTNPETKEKAAAWLRSELKRLREAQRAGKHPARRNKVLSELDIADLVVTMIEAVNALDGQLLSVLQELLNVDRHRKTLAINREKFTQAASCHAQSELQGKAFSVRDLARQASISVSTASQWKRSSEYQRLVSTFKDAWKSRLEKQVKHLLQSKPDLSEKRAFRMAMLIDFLEPTFEKIREETDSEKKAALIKSLNLPALLDKMWNEFHDFPVLAMPLPPDQFSEISSEDVGRQQAAVMAAIEKMMDEVKEGVRQVST